MRDSLHCSNVSMGPAYLQKKKDAGLRSCFCQHVRSRCSSDQADSSSLRFAEVAGKTITRKACLHGVTPGVKDVLINFFLHKKGHRETEKRDSSGEPWIESVLI